MPIRCHISPPIYTPFTMSTSQSVSRSPMVGGAGGNPYSFTCPPGSFITNIAGRSANWFDGARFICSDGSTSPWYGGTGGDPWDEASDSGYSGWLSARGANYVDQLTMRKKDGSAGTSRGGDGGDPVAWSGCPSGQLIVGARGYAQRYLDGISFTCGPIAAQTPPPSIYDAGTVYTQPPPSQATYNPASPLSSPPPATTPPYSSTPPGSNTPKIPPAQPANTWLIIGFVFFIIVVIIIGILMSGDDTPANPQPYYAPPVYPQYVQQEYAPPAYAQPTYVQQGYAPEYAPQGYAQQYPAQ